MKGETTSELNAIHLHGKCCQHVTNVPLIILRCYAKGLDAYTKSYAIFLNKFQSDQNRKQLFLGSNFIQICSNKMLLCSVCQGLQNEPKFAQFELTEQKFLTL